MGAWGYRHFDNDSALDWMGTFIELPIALVIRGTLYDFLKQKRIPTKAAVKRTRTKDAVSVACKPKSALSRRYGHDDVVAAAALLDGLTPYDPGREVKICLRAEAEHG